MNPRQMTCCCETLESRTLLSAIPIQDGLTAHLYSGSITFGGYTYFMGRDVAHGFELWRTDGTTAGTTLVKDINPISSSDQAYGSHPQSFMVFNGRLLFTAQDGNQASDQGLWRTDGTEAGTIKLFSNIDTRNGLEREGWYLFNRKLIGLGEDGLVETDGTPEGTRLVVADPESNSLVRTVDRFYWRSGTRVKSWDGFTVRTEASAIDYYSSMSLQSSFGYGVRFSYVRNIGGSLVPQVLYLAPRELVVRPHQEQFHNYDHNDDVEFKGMKFYNGFDGSLWRVGAQPDEDLLIHSDISTGSLTISGDRLFFTEGRQLWKTDGTAEGTLLVKDFPGYPTGPRYLFGTASDLYFVLEETPLVLQPWRSDGTTAGTVRAADVAPPGASQNSMFGLGQHGSNILVGARDRLWRIPTVPSPTRAPRPSLPSEVLRITGTGGNDDVRIGSFVQDRNDVTELDVLGTR